MPMSKFQPPLGEFSMFQENIPTVLGQTVSRIINKIGITTRLTAEMEHKIEQIKTIKDIEGFRTWIIEITTKFIDNLKSLPNEVL